LVLHDLWEFRVHLRGRLLGRHGLRRDLPRSLRDRRHLHDHHGLHRSLRGLPCHHVE